jgi:hypothetical protein
MRKLQVRLIHDGVQPGAPLSEPLRFGLQDAKGEVHPGLEAPGAPRNFDFALDVSGDEKPVFRGSFAHGAPSVRFVYLSWKRVGEHAHPWGWRIKIPLAGITWDDIAAAEAPGMCLAANVVGRKPHTSQPVTWQVMAQ